MKATAKLRALGPQFRKFGRDGEMHVRRDKAGQRVRRDRGVGRRQRAERAAGRGDPRQERATAADFDKRHPPADPSDRMIDRPRRRNRARVG